jgi:hypothetical protein
MPSLAGLLWQEAQLLVSTLTACVSICETESGPLEEVAAPVESRSSGFMLLEQFW